jgi:hypothetical protein
MFTVANMTDFVEWYNYMLSRGFTMSQIALILHFNEEDKYGFQKIK